MLWVKKISRNERSRLLLVHRLRNLSCYSDILRKLINGESASAVARWAKSLNLPGDAGKWSYLHWRNMVTAVATFVREAMEQARTSAPERPDPAIVLRKYRRLMDELESAAVDPIPELAEKISDDIKAATEQLKAEGMLKHVFLLLKLRLERVIEQEHKLGIILSEGTKIAETMRGVLAELLKLELGEEGLRLVHEATADPEERSELMTRSYAREIARQV